jgi:hypothetical protein
MIFFEAWRLAAIATGVCLLLALAAILPFKRAHAANGLMVPALIAAASATAFGLCSIDFLGVPALRLGAFSFDLFSLAVAVAAVPWGVTKTAAHYHRRLAVREAEFDARCAMMAREAQDQLRERNSQLDAR